jgi:hypothetical protein
MNEHSLESMQRAGDPGVVETQSGPNAHPGTVIGLDQKKIGLDGSKRVVFVGLVR